MKSYNHLFEKLICSDNLKTAIYNSAKRKRKRHDVKRILGSIDAHIEKIQTMLIQRAYVPQEHAVTEIYDMNSKKIRLLIQPKYIYEQIIHHAIIQVLQPIFMQGMYDFSCGSIPDRGVHHGKKYIEKFIKRCDPQEVKYVLKLDIRHYYQSVDIDILKAKLRKKIHDDNMLYVINVILDSNKAEYNGETINMGLPIGFYTSQWFANWFLQDFDHFIKEQLKIKCYVRYVDDVVIFGKNKKQLHKDFKEIQKYIENLNLEIKSNWQIFKFDYTGKDGTRKGRPLDFMGFKFHRDKTTLRRSILLKATRKAKQMSKKEKLTWYDASQLLSYMGWFHHSNTYGSYLKWVKPFVDIQSCKKLLSARQKKINKENENVARMENC